jgi:hypothetical protein
MRILVYGLAISLLVHGALLGLGRLNFGSSDVAEGSLSVVTLPPDTEVEKPEVRDGPSSPTPTQFQPVIELASAAVGPDLSDYPFVLERAQNGPPAAPLVPRPRTTPVTVETGLTPMRTPVPASATLAMGGEGSQGNGMDRVRVLVLMPAGMGRGGDSCKPGRHINYTRSPVVNSLRMRRW